MIVLNVPEVIKKHGITPNPDADQHFMVDETALESVVSAAKITSEEVVLEIGAGIGNLTKLLAKKAKRVYAIEKDNGLEPVLREETSGFQNVEIIIGDALKTDFPQFDKLVANLPYQICEALIQKLIFVNFGSAVVCVPETFAKTMCAKEGKDYSRLSIIAQAFFEAEIVGDIAKESFYPKPRTKSVLLKLVVKKQLKFRDYVLQEIFRQHDKKLKNALREALIFASRQTGSETGTKRAAREFIRRAGIPETLLQKDVAGLTVKDINELKKCVTF